MYQIVLLRQSAMPTRVEKLPANVSHLGCMVYLPEQEQGMEEVVPAAL